MYICHLVFRIEALINNRDCFKSKEPVFLFFEADISKIIDKFSLNNVSILSLSDKGEFSGCLSKHLAKNDCRCVSYY